MFRSLRRAANLFATTLADVARLLTRPKLLIIREDQLAQRENYLADYERHLGSVAFHNAVEEIQLGAIRRQLQPERVPHRTLH